MTSENPRQALDQAQEQSFLMLREALGGDDPRVAQARGKFQADGGAELIKKTFGSDSQKLEQATDVMQFGKVQTATLVKAYSGNFVTDDKGVESVLHNMTEREHALYKRGELVSRGITDKSQEDQEALAYYNKLHDALYSSTGTYTDIVTSPLSTMKRALGNDPRRQNRMALLNDLAERGHETLLGRIARADGSVMSGLTAIRNMTPEDWDLFHKDPVYRAEVFAASGGKDSYNGNTDTQFDYNDALIMRKELNRVFVAPDSYEAAQQANRYTLRDTIQGFGFNKANDVAVYNAVKNATPKEYAALDPFEKHMLDDRLKQMAAGASESAQGMVAQLKAGQAPTFGLREQFDYAYLQGVSSADLARRLITMKEEDPASFQKLQDQSNTSLRESMKRAFGTDWNTAQEILKDGQLTADRARALNTEEGTLTSIGRFVGLVNGPKGDGTVNAMGFYQSLQSLSPDARVQLNQRIGAAGQGDAASQQSLDNEFRGLSSEQRQIAQAVLANDDRKMHLADRIRAQVIGDISRDSDGVSREFAQLSQEQRLAAAKEYQAKYHGTLGAQWVSSITDAHLRETVQALVAFSNRDTKDINDSHLVNTTRGNYTTSLPIEKEMKNIELRRAANDPATEAKRKQLEAKLDEDTRRYAQALKENDENKKEYARQVSNTAAQVIALVATPFIPGAT
ncbi:MAG: hypothetical protein ACRD3W_16875, partial [Terriglobales bacterium]